MAAAKTEGEKAPAGDEALDAMEATLAAEGASGVRAKPAPDAGSDEKIAELEAEIARLQGRTVIVEPAERQDGPGARTLDEPVQFRSKGTHFQATMIAATRWTGANGEVQVNRGLRCEFAPFGTYETDDGWIVDQLRGRPSFNNEFWEVGAEPHAAPDPEIVLDKIMAAALELDDDALEEIERLEQASHKRDVVLKQVARARNRVQGLSAPAGE